MDITFTYDKSVYNTNAAEEIVPQLVKDFQLTSVVDVGCGIGTWLKVFQACGIKDLLGIDGKHVNKNLLLIEDKNFMPADLNYPLSLERKFDLALSLEVAEHLPEESADIFIKTITGLSDTVVFSAAIPGQGGHGHLNERYHGYWREKFLNAGYEIIEQYSQKLWNNNKIEWWYKQNIFIYKKQTTINSMRQLDMHIHPELYKKKLQEIDKLKIEKINIYKGKVSVVQGFKIFCKSIIRSISYKSDDRKNT